MILPLIGLALLTPPLGGIFQLDIKIAGVPFTLVYLFVIWAALIACAWALSRHLASGAPQSALALRPGAHSELCPAEDGACRRELDA